MAAETATLPAWLVTLVRAAETVARAREPEARIEALRALDVALEAVPEDWRRALELGDA